MIILPSFQKMKHFTSCTITMKISRKIFVAVVWFTWVWLMSLWAYAAVWHQVRIHHPHHNEATDFWSGKNVKFLPFSFEKTTTQVDLNEVDKTALKSEKRWKKGHEEWSWENLEFHGWALGFLWNFLDDSNLTDDQKLEIQLLQANKQKKMWELLKEMTSTTGDTATIENEMKEVNNKFLESLKAYISEDKVTEYDEFLNELPEWNMKAEKKKWKKVTSEIQN